MNVIKAPCNLPQSVSNFSATVFLAGSIEMGTAEDWQTEITNDLKDVDVTVLNPRRDDWDNSWVQSIDNPQFREQVEWELGAMERSNLIAMYFSPGTKSPITLLEFGLHTRYDSLIVCCPEGFWRKGNIDVVCEFYGVRQVKTLNELSSEIIESFTNQNLIK